MGIKLTCLPMVILHTCSSVISLEQASYLSSYSLVGKLGLPARYRPRTWFITVPSKEEKKKTKNIWH